MRALRVILLIWSAVGLVGVVVIGAVLMDRPGASAMRLAPLAGWLVFYGLNAWYLWRNPPRPS